MSDTAAWLTLGSLMLRANDPMKTAGLLHTYLMNSSPDFRTALEAAGVSCRLVDDFRPVLPNDSDTIARMCELGAAWVIGRQSVPPRGSWQPVVTGRELDPQTFQRLTAETMIGLIVAADRRIRLFSPFLDIGGVESLAFALAAATKRGVDLSIGYRAQADKTHAIRRLVAVLRAEGDAARCTVVPFSGDQSFPHLKLLVVDGVRAYIGSANLTYAALTTNYEVGALVDGDAVDVYERLLDEVLQQQPNSPS